MNASGKIKICTFLHYSTSWELPYYVRIYIEELSDYFDKVLVLSNNTKLHKHNLSLPENIDFVHFENKGYDFGLFYRFIVTQNLNDFSQIAIVNDSNILINKLEAVFQNEEHVKADFWGLIDSHEKPWFSSHTNNYHIQSHFIILNEKAIQLLPSFFQQIEIDVLMNETDLKKVRRMVIDQWEIGLSQYLLKQGLKPMTLFNSKEFRLKYGLEKHNVPHLLYHQLAAENYPLLKRKVVLSKQKWYKRKTNTWQKTVREFAHSDLNAERIIDELKEWQQRQNI